MKTIPQDLRIGNFIQDVGERSSHYVVWEITETRISAGPMTIYSAGFEIDHYILLTPEWLERFGFHEDEPTLSISLDEPVTKELVFNQYSKLFSIFNSGHHTYLGKIQHVHQLQNLYFALTGKELELKQ